MKLAGDTLEEAVEVLLKLQRYEPFRYSGKWLVCKTSRGGYSAFRSMASVRRNIREETQVATVGK